MRPLPAPPPRRTVGRAWPYALLVALVGVAAAGYPRYEALLHRYLPRFVTPRIAAVTAAPAPVLASVAVAPEPALPPASRPSRTEPTASVDVAAALPLPPPPEPPVTLPKSVTGAAQPDIALTWSEILEVQKRLTALGINPGPIDGVVGARTTAGVQRYEERLGHAVTGKVDRSLLTSLRQEPAASAMDPARAP